MGTNESVCVGESLRKNCHIVEGISALPQASFHQYQVKLCFTIQNAIFIIKVSHYVPTVIFVSWYYFQAAR